MAALVGAVGSGAAGSWDLVLLDLPLIPEFPRCCLDVPGLPWIFPVLPGHSWPFLDASRPERWPLEACRGSVNGRSSSSSEQASNMYLVAQILKKDD